MSKPGVNLNVPPVPEPIANLQSLTFVARALRQGVDSLGGNRGDQFNRAVTFSDLVDLGIVTRVQIMDAGEGTAVGISTLSLTNTTPLPSGFMGTVFVRNSAGTDITITLPPFPTLGQEVRGADAVGNAATFTIHWQSADASTIAGLATFDMVSDFQAATFVWNGNAWSVL